MYKIVLLSWMSFLATLSNIALADLKLVELNEMYLDYRSYSTISSNQRNLLLYPEVPKEMINVGFNTDLAKYGYWNNEIQSLTTGQAFKSVGLDSRLGVRITNWLEVGLWHRSLHILEGVYSNMDGRYPNENALQIKIFLYRKPAGKSLIK
jgi:hypothetical protein